MAKQWCLVKMQCLHRVQSSIGDRDVFHGTSRLNFAMDVCAAKLQTARNCFGNTAMEVASKGCRQVMRDYQAGGEAAHASLVEELQREAAELAARLEAERAQSERHVAPRNFHSPCETMRGAVPPHRHQALVA